MRRKYTIEEYGQKFESLKAELLEIHMDMSEDILFHIQERKLDVDINNKILDSMLLDLIFIARKTRNISANLDESFFKLEQLVARCPAQWDKD